MNIVIFLLIYLHYNLICNLKLQTEFYIYTGYV